MILTHRQYMRFLNGGPQFVATVAYLPGDLAARMPTLSTDIRMAGDYAKKIWEKHRLGHNVLGLIPTIVRDGWCTRRQSNQLDFFYVDQVGTPKRYILGLKASRAGQETWVSTLYPTDEHEIRRRLNKARKQDYLLRGHCWD